MCLSMALRRTGLPWACLLSLGPFVQERVHGIRSEVELEQGQE